MARPLRVLVVDDEPAILRTLRFCLGREGFACETETDPHRALRRVRTEPSVHILLTDIVMPGMDGMTLLRALRESGALTQTIVMTAYSRPDRVLDAYQLGALDYLVKPFESLDEVVRVVRNAERRYLRWQKAVERTLKGEGR
ncbi:response regulator, partial [Deferrisoma camini]|uniref:response regulator n=1 Tax=Deferrisoma camini TaxID=1035120 RepID=UPI0004AD995A